MAEFQTLTDLKSVLLAPIKAQLKRTGWIETIPTPTPPTTATSLATRHDHHNIEIKTVTEIGDRPSLVETDLYLFVPRTFELGIIGKAELAKDFRSRMRLALPSSAELGSAALESSLKTLMLSLNKVEAAERSGALDLSHPLSEELTEATKDLCAVIAETLKHGSVDLTRQFMLTHKLGMAEDLCIKGLCVFTEQISLMADMIARVRSVVTGPQAARVAVLALFDEYVSQLFVHFLGSVRAEFERIGIPAAGADSLTYLAHRSSLEALFDELQEREAQHRARFAGAQGDLEHDLDRERRLVRLSHLKKFFQSRTFVEISRHQASKKVSESTATIGTALAGIVAAMVERFSRPEITNVAFQGLFVLSFGVIIYVLRDRLKDYAKTIFQEKASKFLPDFEQQLMAKDRKIGTAREWFRVIGTKDLPADIHSLRGQASSSEMEQRLPEDIFHCRKSQEVNGGALASLGQTLLNRALHENIRINFERHLKHMDDPFKDFTDLDVSGRFTQSRSHRVYHFYLCLKTVSRPIENMRAPLITRPFPLRLWSRRAPGPARSTQTLIYRIVIDKNGVVRLEDVAPN